MCARSVQGTTCFVSGVSGGRVVLVWSTVGPWWISPSTAAFATAHRDQSRGGIYPHGLRETGPASTWRPAAPPQEQSGHCSITSDVRSLPGGQLACRSLLFQSRQHVQRSNRSTTTRRMKSKGVDSRSVCIRSLKGRFLRELSDWHSSGHFDAVSTKAAEILDQSELWHLTDLFWRRWPYSPVTFANE